MGRPKGSRDKIPTSVKGPGLRASKKYTEQTCEQATKLARLGATDEQMADFFGIHVNTFNYWKTHFAGFKESLTRGKAMADAEVADSLYRRALGYSHPAIKINVDKGVVIKTEVVEHYPPDTTACIFWLKNRQPALWRDRIEHTGNNGGAIEVKEVSDLEAARRIAYLLAKAEDVIEGELTEIVH